MLDMARSALAPLMIAAPALAGAADVAPEASGGLSISALNRLTLLLVAVIVVVLLVLWLVRRGSGGIGSISAQMRVLGGVSVGNRERVVLLQVGEEQLLVGVAPGRVERLHVLDEPIEVLRGRRAGDGAADAEGARFAQLLRRGAAAEREDAAG